jgi:hypothetical protein
VSNNWAKLRLKASQRQEKDTAKYYGGRTQPGSGSGWVHRNDVRSKRFLIENKRTDNERSITIKADDLRQLRINATRSDVIGIMEFYLGGHNYVILHRDDFSGYVEDE